jgi:aspartate 1-decarboxylase
MHRTMLKSKIHRATVSAVVDVDNDARFETYEPDELDNYDPRVVHVDAHNQILNVDREVATLLAATNRSTIGAPGA